MKKELKNFIHLYIGCEFKNTDSGDISILKGCFGKIVYNEDADDSGEGTFDIDDCKLILRSLNDVTNEEFKEANAILEMFNPNDIIEQIEGMSAHTKFYLDKHVDIFGLIEAGLAVNVATLETVQK